MNKNDIKKLHNCGKKFFITATGGGTSFLGEFLKTPGGSKIIAGGHTPYATEAFIEFAGKVDNFSDANAARRLAVASYEYCSKLKISPNEAVGIGVACALVKDDERYDREHKINIAIHTTHYTFSFSGKFVQKLRDDYDHIRQFEEDVTNQLIFELMFDIFSKQLSHKELKKNYDFSSTKGVKDMLDGNLEIGYNRMIGSELYVHTTPEEKNKT